MTPTLKTWLVVAAGIACLVLGIMVVGWHPSNEIDLVAGGVIASGVGLLALVFP
jgi:uncharacterized membrane protein